MSDIKLTDIKSKNYTAEDFKQILMESYDGIRFSFSSHNKTAYYALLRAIDAYNSGHQENKANLAEVVKKLTGLDYVTNAESYHMNKLKANMDENGVILHIDEDTRCFLKNKVKRLNRKKGSAEPYDISDAIAKLLPGATYIPKNHIYTDEEIAQMLSSLPVEEGKINFSGAVFLRGMLAKRAEKQGVSLEELVKNYVDVEGIKERNIIPIQQHVANLRNCVDEQKNIVNLSKKYPSTYSFLTKTARKQGCSIDVLLNKLLDSPLMEYKYRGVNNKLSMYDVNSPTYIGNNPEYAKRLAGAIRDCMDTNNSLKGLFKHPREYKMLDYICRYSGLDRQTVYKMFVPEVKYHERNKPIFSYQTQEDVLNNLKYFDDGSGCIDSVRKNKSAIKALRLFAKAEGLHVSDFVAKNSNYYFSYCGYEVDYIDVVIHKLIDRYGYGGNASRLYKDDAQLYGAVMRIKNFFPGGAKKSMEETLLALGFDYDGLMSKSKVTKEYVSWLLQNYYGNENNVIESLYENDAVGYAVMNYSGKIGKSVKDTLEDFGYKYYKQNPDQQKRLARMKMTPKEYKTYINNKDDEEFEK